MLEYAKQLLEKRIKLLIFERRTVKRYKLSYELIDNLETEIRALKEVIKLIEEAQKK